MIHRQPIIDTSQMVIDSNLTDLQIEILKNRVTEQSGSLSSLDYTNANFDPIKDIHKLADIDLAGSIIADTINRRCTIVVSCDYDSDNELV